MLMREGFYRFLLGDVPVGYGQVRTVRKIQLRNLRVLVRAAFTFKNAYSTYTAFFLPLIICSSS